VTAPLTIDTITFTDSFDFATFARDVLRGGAGTGSLPTDMLPLDWVFRAWPQLKVSLYGERLSLALSECLTDADPLVRVQALMFFARHPDASGAERVVKLASGDMRLFVGVANPLGASTDLEWWLWRCVGGRIEVGDHAAASIARGEVKLPGRSSALLASLTDADPDWVTANAEEIVRANPDAGAVILGNLSRMGRDVGKLGVQIAPFAVRDPAFRESIERFIEDPAARAAILNAVK
jgi:hypothetical protein